MVINSLQNKNIMKVFGIILIGLGIVMMIFTGFNLITKDKVADLGPVEISKEEKTPVNWSPIVGGILLAGGIVLVIAGKKSS